MAIEKDVRVWTLCSKVMTICAYERLLSGSALNNNHFNKFDTCHIHIGQELILHGNHLLALKVLNQISLNGHLDKREKIVIR